MNQHGLIPNLIIYNSLVSACEKGELPELAMKVFQAMQQQGMVLNEITCSSLVSAFQKAEQPERTLEVFQVMHREHVLPDKFSTG